MTRRLAFFCLFSSFGASLSFAGTSTSTVAVSATVINSCSIVAAPLVFGNYDGVVGSLTNPLPGTAILTVVCTLGSGSTVTLGQGSNAATGSTDAAPARRLKGTGTDYLTYGLFQDAAYATVWGNTPTTGKAVTGGLIAQLLTVYGKIDPGQNVGAGIFTDSVVATVTF